MKSFPSQLSRRHWADVRFVEDTGQRTMTTRTYKLLLEKQKETGSIIFRLPSVQTCRLKIKGFKCPPGLNPEMLFLMEKKFDSLPCPEDKNCVLSCDEMDLNKKWSYDQRLKRLFPPHKVTMMYE